MRYVWISALVIAAASLVFWAGYSYHEPVIAKQIRDRSDAYPLISPLIGVSLGPKELFPQYEPLQKRLSNIIDEAKESGKISRASVYFRDLETGTWTGIGENDLYAPSSMLKVVVMLAYLDHAEDDPSALDALFPYTGTDKDGYYAATTTLPVGRYPAKLLLERMIVYSDNNALVPLYEAVADKIAAVNSALQLPLPATPDASADFMSPRAYSLVLRTLYNSTYLSRSVSESALEMLSRATFSKGIVAGIPSGITVAHKFGERTNSSGDESARRELHDCGIVYIPNNPYLLCVMTRGKDFDSLSALIAEISKAAYELTTRQQKI
jgi:beta-lactamase class A